MVIPYYLRADAGYRQKGFLGAGVHRVALKHQLRCRVTLLGPFCKKKFVVRRAALAETPKGQRQLGEGRFEGPFRLLLICFGMGGVGWRRGGGWLGWWGVGHVGQIGVQKGQKVEVCERFWAV